MRTYPGVGRLQEALGDLNPWRENDRTIRVGNHAVFKMRLDGARENDPLYVSSSVLERLYRLLVRNTLNILLYDRAFIEGGGYVVRGSADHLNAALPGSPIGASALEGWQKRVMNINNRQRSLI